MQIPRHPHRAKRGYPPQPARTLPSRDPGDGRLGMTPIERLAAQAKREPFKSAIPWAGALLPFRST